MQLQSPPGLQRRHPMPENFRLWWLATLWSLGCDVRASKLVRMPDDPSCMLIRTI